MAANVTFDPVELLVVIACVLLMVGVIPFTPVAVGALVLGTLFKLQIAI